MRIRQVKSLVGGETLVEPVITKEKEMDTGYPHGYRRRTASEYCNLQLCGAGRLSPRPEYL